MKISIAVVAALFHILVVSDGVSGRALKGAEPCVVPTPTRCLTKAGVNGVLAAFEGAVVAISNVSSWPKKRCHLLLLIVVCLLMMDVSLGCIEYY
jgi:hypothetical protein